MKKFIALVLSATLLFSFMPTVFAADAQDKPYDNSNFFDYEDYTLHYRIYESEAQAKNQILLIHGFCLSTASLEGVATEYQKSGYDVVLVDAPNFGYSSRENSKTNLLSREEVIFALMAELGGTWIVGGHSMGGGIAINLACDYPETVTGLVLFAPQSSNEARGLMSKLSSSCLMQTVYNLILAVALRLPPVVRMLVDTSFSDSEYAKTYDLNRITAPLSLKGTGAGITIMASHTRGNDFEKLSKLDIPCAVITAVNDQIAIAQNIQQIIENAPEGAYTYEFSEGGHMMMEYAPYETAQHTLPTIAKCK